jgi:hypothetical protein
MSVNPGNERVMLDWRQPNAKLKGDGSDSLKLKLELEMQTAIDEEYVLEKKRNTCHTVQKITDTHNIVPCDMYTSCV